LRSLARSHTANAIAALAGIMQKGQNDAARVAAACALLDRGWGKPPLAITGEHGEGNIQVREFRKYQKLILGIFGISARLVSRAGRPGFSGAKCHLMRALALHVIWDVFGCQAVLKDVPMDRLYNFPR
jgi:hypothetical protein